jgi:hypothetical protein
MMVNRQRSRRIFHPVQFPLFRLNSFFCTLYRDIAHDYRIHEQH